MRIDLWARVMVGLVSGEPAVIIRKQMVVALTKAAASGTDRRGQDSSRI